MIRFVFSVVAAIAIALWPAIVLSQNESGQLTIVVVDANSSNTQLCTSCSWLSGGD